MRRKTCPNDSQALVVNRPDGPGASAADVPGFQEEQPMPDAVGNIAGAVRGGAVDGAAGGTDDDSQKAQAFQKALSQFAMQIVMDGNDEMSQAMRDTEEDFE